MDKFVNIKEKKEKHKNKSKLKRRQSEFVNKILSKSGSYSLDSNDVTTNSNMNILNDKIELNSVERFIDNVNTTQTPSFLNKTNETSTTNSKDKSSISYNRDATHIVESFNSDNFPRKKTFMGFPLLCFTYFAAIYSLLAYGATSLLSIIELMMNNSPKIFPLYLLLAGYLLITLMSFLLIVAIQREKLNLILFWIISLSVFILPEIGLNIVLAENSFNWFNTTKGLYTLVALVIRVTIDLPCIGIILAYHINRTKRNNFLQKMIKPLRRDIMNGDVLKSYNNLDLYPVIDQMPKPIKPICTTPNKSETKETYSKIIGFNLEDSQSEKSYESENTYEESKTIPQLKTNADQSFNAYNYKFNPGVNYEILVRPSKNAEFSQKFVNIENIKLKKNNHFESANKLKYIPTNSNKPVVIQTEQIKNTKYDFQKEQSLKLNEENVKKQIKDNWLSNIGKSKTQKYETIEKTIDLYDENSHTIPIKYETLKSTKEKIRPLFPFLNQTLPFTAEKEIRKKYLDSTRNNQRLNINNHRIYLPSPSSMIECSYDKTIPKSNYHWQNDFQYKSTSVLKNQECNCVNIASCSKEKLSEFLHSDECIFSKKSFNKNNSSATMYLSNPDLFIQRKHF